MSIKDEVNYLKNELSGDEKLLESAFKLESLYKKYKLPIWGAVVAVLLFFVVSTGMDALRQSRLEAANQALLTLQKNPADTQAKALLKEKDPALYELFTFSQAAAHKDMKALSALETSKNDVVADMSRYSVGAIAKKPVDSTYYKELSYLEEAYSAIKSGHTKIAKEKLELIDTRSPLATFAKLLEHTTLKAQ